jgi:FtsP/CotA-like multicopper oxidase with cupredoxin domain
MLVFAGSAQAGDCDLIQQGLRIEDPPEFQWQPNSGYQSGTLEIGQATFSPATSNDIGGESLITRAYRQDPSEVPTAEFTIPGPTIKMTPGETYVLTFKNTLEFEQPSPVHNDLKDPNITNIHTHGLHVSGETPADDITRLINGGFCADYVYQVPADHMGGTLWYHAHHHGSTYLQVAGGAFGLLIVEDSANDIATIPPLVSGMKDRLLAIGYLDPDVAGVGGDTLISGTLSPTWTVNGKVGGSLCTPAKDAPLGEWQHWRVLLADRDARMKTLSVGPECEAVLLARDGVWRRIEVPKLLPNNEIELTGASRADLAVRCGADSTISVNGETVANVVADGSLPANIDVGPYSNGATGNFWSIPDAQRPPYLRDLRSIQNVENRSVNMGARTVNGKKFDVNEPTFRFEAGSVQEWNIKGARQHPFHQHVYHVQMNGACGTAFEDGEYYDTVAGNCLVRFNLNPATSSVYEGRTIMHCHILLHEDEGAMGFTDVLQSQGTIGHPTDPSVPHEPYLCGAPPCAAPTPTLETAVPADGQVTLTWSDESADPNVIGYNVYYDNAQLVADAGLNTTYTDTGRTNGQEYCYEVTSYYDATCESGFSNILCATPNVPVVCSPLGRQACKDEPACRWINKTKTCIDR